MWNKRETLICLHDPRSNQPSPTLLWGRNVGPVDSRRGRLQSPTMQLSHWVTSLEAVYQITCSFLWSHNKLYTTAPVLVVLSKTCEHTLMCKIGAVYPLTENADGAYNFKMHLFYAKLHEWCVMRPMPWNRCLWMFICELDMHQHCRIRCEEIS